MIVFCASVLTVDCFLSLSVSLQNQYCRLKANSWVLCYHILVTMITMLMKALSRTCLNAPGESMPRNPQVFVFMQHGLKPIPSWWQSGHPSQHIMSHILLDKLEHRHLPMVWLRSWIIQLSSAGCLSLFNASDWDNEYQHHICNRWPTDTMRTWNSTHQLILPRVLSMQSIRFQSNEMCYFWHMRRSLFPLVCHAKAETNLLPAHCPIDSLHVTSRIEESLQSHIDNQLPHMLVHACPAEFPEMHMIETISTANAHPFQ